MAQLTDSSCEEDDGLSSNYSSLWWKSTAFWFVLWTLIGIGFAFQLRVTGSHLGREISLGQALSWSLADWYVYGLLAWVASPLSLKFQFHRSSIFLPATVHIGACCLFCLLYVVVRAVIGQVQGRIMGEVLSYQQLFRPLIQKTLIFSGLIYWVVVIFQHALAYYLENIERRKQSAELETRLVEAKLRTLRSQLNPHFLFNTLNAISTLMHKDLDSAERMLSRLSDLLRHALENLDLKEITLRQELEMLDRYLQIEKIRFGDRLKITLNIQKEALELRFPNLLLQPLVENSIRHGITPVARPGHVEIFAKIQDDQLVVLIMDDGVGLRSNSRGGFGIGLTNTRSRLEALHGDNFRFELAQREEGGACVHIRIPART